MKRSTRKSKIAVVGLSIGVMLAVAVDAQQSGWNPVGGFDKTSRPTPTNFLDTVRRTADMVNDLRARETVRKHGLEILNLTWEDTGRFKNSAVGPNISDMTIQVATETPHGQVVRAMPVIRFNNFTDKTADLDPEGFTLLVGNQSGLRRDLKRVSLREYLENPRLYLTNPQSWKGFHRSLLAARDSKVLVSAQACFLPVPEKGKATFNPVLFNYQSIAGDPAVLTLLVTREGTSATIIDNKRDAFREGNTWGQRLFFNRRGQRASLTGERLSDFNASNPGLSTGKDSGLNMVLLVQVPLKQKNPLRGGMGGGGFGGGFAAGEAATKSKSMGGASDVEAAVIGSGIAEGPFTEIDNLEIERDDRFPVRVTVQFYKATSNGIVSDADIAQIRKEIDQVYAYGSSVGSLVVGGETGRITEYEGFKVQPRGWWEDFWRRHQANTGESRNEAIAKLQKLLGKDYLHRPVTGLYLNDLLRNK